MYKIYLSEQNGKSDSLLFQQTGEVGVGKVQGFKTEIDDAYQINYLSVKIKVTGLNADDYTNSALYLNILKLYERYIVKLKKQNENGIEIFNMDYNSFIYLLWWCGRQKMEIVKFPKIFKISSTEMYVTIYLPLPNIIMNRDLKIFEPCHLIIELHKNVEDPIADAVITSNMVEISAIVPKVCDCGFFVDDDEIDSVKCLECQKKISKIQKLITPTIKNALKIKSFHFSETSKNEKIRINVVNETFTRLHGIWFMYEKGASKPLTLDGFFKSDNFNFKEITVFYSNTKMIQYMNEEQMGTSFLNNAVDLTNQCYYLGPANLSKRKTHFRDFYEKSYPGELSFEISKMDKNDNFEFYILVIHV